MSADNYNLVLRRDDDQWDVYLNLSASSDRWTQVDASKPDHTFASSHEAKKWADSEGYTEYVTVIIEARPPRRGRVQIEDHPRDTGGVVLSVWTHQHEMWLTPQDLDDLRHLIMDDLALEMDRVRTRLKELESCAQWLRAQHTCMKDLRSASCAACNRGMPYPHASVDELLKDRP